MGGARRRRFLAGASLGWFTPSGAPMTIENWNDPNARCITIHLDGDADPDRAADGTLEVGDDFLVLVNGWWEPLHFVVPDTGQPRKWLLELDSHDGSRAVGTVEPWSGDAVPVGPGSILLLRSPNPRPGEDPHEGR